MAKSVEQARARRKKQAQQQAQKERELWNKVKKPLLIAVCVVAAVLIGSFVWNNFIYLPKNGVRVSGGSITGADSSWVVANLGTTSKPECYHMATYTAPEGYTLDTGSSMSTNTLTQTLYYKADDENAAIRTIYVAAPAGKKPEEMIETLLNSGYFTGSERLDTSELAGLKVSCMYSTTASTDENGQTIDGVGSASLYIYTDAMKDSSCAVIITTQDGDMSALPTAEEMVAMAEPFLAGLKIVQE